MEFTIIEQNKHVQVQLRGQFTFADNQKFKELLERVYAYELSGMTLDFEHIDFIDSAGLGMLLLLRDNCNSKNIQLVLMHPRGQVEKIFTISRFEQLFSVIR